MRKILFACCFVFTGMFAGCGGQVLPDEGGQSQSTTEAPIASEEDALTEAACANQNDHCTYNGSDGRTCGHAPGEYTPSPLPRKTVTGSCVNLRYYPSTSQGVTGHAYAGTQFTVYRITNHGQSIFGNTTWYLSHYGWISAYYCR